MWIKHRLKVLTDGGHQCMLYWLLHKSKDSKHLNGKRDDSAGIQGKKWFILLEGIFGKLCKNGDTRTGFLRKSRSVLGVHWKDWCWDWNSNTLATSCKKLTHWKRLWCWEGLGTGGEGDDRGWDGWMASLTRWTWVWVNSGSWWCTGRPGVLQFMGSQSRTWLSDWTELNWEHSKYSTNNLSCSILLRGFQMLET